MNKRLKKICAQQFEESLLAMTEECKQSLGQELHDNLGQQLAAIAYQSRALEKKIVNYADVESAQVAAAIALQAQQALMACKQLAQGLLPFELARDGLAIALSEFATSIAHLYDIHCEVSCTEEIAIQDATVALHLYRIAQEAINNALRHAGAQHLAIALTLKKNRLRLSIIDDGCGFSGDHTQADSTSMGIKIMHYRAHQLGAKLHFFQLANGGTEVRVKMKVR